MHILICDDDAAFGTRMAEYVADYFAARSILVQTAVCTSAGQALETPELELYQLAFLDVDMPNVNGMALGRQLKQKCPGLKLVYVSAYLEFALEGYTVNAYRYLLKRDIVHTLPSCLDDLLAELTDQRKTLTCTTTAPPQRSRWIRSIIWKATCARSTFMATSPASPSAPTTEKSSTCRRCCTRTAFCR